MKAFFPDEKDTAPDNFCPLFQRVRFGGKLDNIHLAFYFFNLAVIKNAPMIALPLFESLPSQRIKPLLG